jgi:Dyp-type peroxidase family
MAEDILNIVDSIDPHDSRYQVLLDDLQGNIFKGHGRDHTVHIFLRFNRDQQATKQLIRAFAAEYLRTSASRQQEEAAHYAKSKTPGDVFANFLLTYKGYKALGFLRDRIPGDKRFQAGMKQSRDELSDPDSQGWEDLYREQIDAMILLADDDLERLDAWKARVLQHFHDILLVVGQGKKPIEHGKALRNANDDTIEHFGYVDGRSQPLLLPSDVAREHNTGGIDEYNPSAPLSLVLVKDPNGKTAASYGSYLVFRKLEQNVQRFKEAEERLAKKLGLAGEDEERAGAMIVGRFEDGTPLTLQYGEGMHHPVFNNFNYDNDRDGAKCPFHAHIRKVNPRGDSVRESQGKIDRDEERRHRIVRRGITYGDREVDLEGRPTLKDRPTNDVGLLFMCFQSNIADQFEFIQKSMANDPDFVKRGTGPDPVIAQGQSQPQEWPVKWGEPDTQRVPFDFHGFVTLKGGEYFFAPSISFLKNL